MLVLSRKESQQVVIDGNIVLRVNHISKGRVSIGIDAPHDVHIRRGELVERKRKEHLQTATSDSD